MLAPQEQEKKSEMQANGGPWEQEIPAFSVPEVHYWNLFLLLDIKRIILRYLIYIFLNIDIVSYKRATIKKIIYININIYSNNFGNLYLKTSK